MFFLHLYRRFFISKGWVPPKIKKAFRVFVETLFLRGFYYYIVMLTGGAEPIVTVA